MTTMKPGRWPANIIHDGSEEVIAAFPDAPAAAIRRKWRRATARHDFGNFGAQIVVPRGFGDSGSAARFFYTPRPMLTIASAPSTPPLSL
jgi:site-specific DNA-methyltransferase (adenine-specific)